MKTYTGTGDHGKTSLLSGERVSKSSERIGACGEIDELNSAIGVLVAALSEEQTQLADALQAIQGDLLRLGARLSVLPGSPVVEALDKFHRTRVKFIEQLIDRLENRLVPLANFILPGGHPSAAWAHFIRCVCRRAERQVLRLLPEGATSGEPDPQFENMLMYLNRLSDYFFVLARHLNHHHGVPEHPWRR